MASNGPWQPNGGFEDQLRRMIITDNQSPSNVQDPAQNGQPTVRRPPSGAYHTQQQGYNNPVHQQRGPLHTWHNRHTSSPHNQYGSSPGPNQSTTNGGSHSVQQQGHYGRPPNVHQQRGGFAKMNHHPRGSPGPQPSQQRSRFQQPMALDPNAFHRGGFDRPQRGRGGGAQHLFNPNQPRNSNYVPQADQHARQTQHLEQVASVEVGNVEMSPQEREEKEAFRAALEQVCHEVCTADAERLPQVSLESFGSFQSGFATAGSDMDLVIVVKDQTSTSACFSLLEHDLPRALEKRLLDLGYGGRLLTRTRVPIIKVCEKPGASFLDKLREERWKWDDLPNEKKYPHLHPQEDVPEEEIDQSINDPIPTNPDGTVTLPELRLKDGCVVDKGMVANESQAGVSTEAASTETTVGAQQIEEANHAQQVRREEPWTRERKAGPLDFPKSGIGIQSDINFFNPLGLHNTQLLRCYSLCDSRVRPMILFVKAWAKKRKINSSYSGTLSSYGYVLMVLHYLANVANPPVLPNLQGPQFRQMSDVEVDGWNVNFWNDEQDIMEAAQRGQLTSNREPLGSLLNGFFLYYSSLGGGHTFHWMSQVLSLRSAGGILTKEEKGWVKAVTEESEGKKVQHRYLFCIEDPFELSHNVARTVTHNGIVAIRDEFRRARRIMIAIGNGLVPHEGELFADLTEAEDTKKPTDPPKRVNGVPNGAVDGTQESPQTEAAKLAAMEHMAANRRAHEANLNNNRTNSRRGRRGTPNAPPTGPHSRQQSFDVHDSDAFPTLGAAKPSKKKASHLREQDGEFSEISGAKAQAHLAEVKRLKDEAQAESTATGAAEAVLNGID